MIITVTLNIALDKFYKVPSFSIGDVYRVEKMIQTAGGKGLNVARIIDTLGHPVKAIGISGGYTGKLICELLAQEGIEFEFTEASIESRNCINIMSENGVSTELLESGDEVREETVSSFLSHFTRQIASAEVVTLSGSVLRGMPQNIYAQLVAIARKQQKKIILDTNGEYLVHGITEIPTVIKPNRQEIEQIMGIEKASTDQVIDYCMSYINKGIEIVMVSLGHEGALLITKNGVWKGTPPELQIVNTVGSGDSMVGAIAIGLVQKESPEQLLRNAIAVSAANTLTESTGKVQISDITKIYKQIQVSKIR